MEIKRNLLNPFFMRYKLHKGNLVKNDNANKIKIIYQLTIKYLE